MTAAASPLPARIVFISNDLGIYLVIALLLLGTQFLVWLFARDTTEVDWWRSMALCAVVGFVMFILTQMGAQSGKSWIGPVAGMLAASLMVGFLYEMEVWQRILTSLGTPCIAIGSFFSGYWLKGYLLTHVFS
ncbi:MAG: hypothetical protein AAGJ31_04860 [Verrucomicrobiota bacterium]